MTMRMKNGITGLKTRNFVSMNIIVSYTDIIYKKCDENDKGKVIQLLTPERVVAGMLNCRK